MISNWYVSIRRLSQLIFTLLPALRRVGRRVPWERGWTFHPSLACPQRITVYLKSSKKDIAREGQSLNIACTSLPLCSYAKVFPQGASPTILRSTGKRPPIGNVQCTQKVISAELLWKKGMDHLWHGTSTEHSNSSVSHLPNCWQWMHSPGPGMLPIKCPLSPALSNYVLMSSCRKKNYKKVSYSIYTYVDPQKLLRTQTRITLRLDQNFT